MFSIFYSDSFLFQKFNGDVVPIIHKTDWQIIKFVYRHIMFHNGNASHVQGFPQSVGVYAISTRTQRECMCFNVSKKIRASFQCIYNFSN